MAEGGLARARRLHRPRDLHGGASASTPGSSTRPALTGPSASSSSARSGGASRRWSRPTSPARRLRPARGRHRPQGRVRPAGGRLFGVRPIRLAPGGAARLNPLDLGLDGGPTANGAAARKRLALVQSIAGSSLDRPLAAEERTAIERALGQVSAGRGAPTLPGWSTPSCAPRRPAPRPLPPRSRSWPPPAGRWPSSCAACAAATCAGCSTARPTSASTRPRP